MKKNTIVFWGQYPGNYETKFFPLRFEGILYNSVPPFDPGPELKLAWAQVSAEADL